MATIRHINEEEYAAKAQELLNHRREGYVNYALSLLKQGMSPGQASATLWWMQRNSGLSLKLKLLLKKQRRIIMTKNYEIIDGRCVIPTSVDMICAYAFSDCLSLTGIELPF